MKIFTSNLKHSLATVVVTIVLMGTALSFLSISTYAQSSTLIQSWYLVDSGKHLDWSGTITDQSQFNTAVTKWNGYKSGVIRPDTAFTIQDVFILNAVIDVEPPTIAITLSQSAQIIFGGYQMTQLTTNQKINVCAHELGHALGLAHSSYGNIMYDHVSSVVNLTQTDKNAYNASYARY